jgi:DNA polymerase III delta subunit
LIQPRARRYIARHVTRRRRQSASQRHQGSVIRAGVLLHGEDDYLKNEELRRVTDAAVDPATRDFNYESLRGADLDAEKLGSILGTPPMMADRRWS